MEKGRMEIKTICLDLMKKYQGLLKKLKPSRERVPGFLEIDDRHHTPQYYHCKTEKGGKQRQRKYLGTAEWNSVKKLAQQSYDRKIAGLLGRRLQQLQEWNLDFSDDEIDAVYETMKPSRRELVTPIAPTKRQKLEDWLSQPFTPLYFSSDATSYGSKNGERVRSKSEKILADLFYDRKIVYKYECPLYIENQVYYPDFTFYDAMHEKEIYWEHFGMMGDPDYSNHALKKLQFYETHGICIGDNLIVTFESDTCSLAFEVAEMRIDLYLQHSSLY